MAPTAEDAEDLAQELAIIVLAHRTGPPDADRFVGWCCGVVRNLAAQRRRSEMMSRRRAAEDAALAPEDAVAGASYDPESRAILRESLALVLGGLQPRSPRLLRDRVVLEETSEEIAARMQMSSASVRMRLARVLAGLRGVDEGHAGD